jgi:hypothetical protein
MTPHAAVIAHALPDSGYIIVLRGSLHHRRWHMQALVCCTRRDKSRKRLMASPLSFHSRLIGNAASVSGAEVAFQALSSFASGLRWRAVACISCGRSITEEHSHGTG